MEVIRLVRCAERRPGNKWLLRSNLLEILVTRASNGVAQYEVHARRLK
jgi:hypothetical protein